MEWRAPLRQTLPLAYFNSDWVNTISKQHIIAQPLAGLTNLGNSCFMNTVLQCLAYCPGLPFFAEHIPNLLYERSMDHIFFLHHFGRLVKEMKSSQLVSPGIFFQNLSKICPGMESGYQQDAHEFLFALLNIFDDECARAFSTRHEYYDTAVHALFGCELTGKRVCKRCKCEEDVSSRFLDVTIQLDYGTIEECFASFMTPQMGEHVCEKCHHKTKCHERLSISHMPEILVVTMMRFASNGSKIENVVDFGLELDLTSFCESETSGVFELFAVIVHNGHHIHKGHFMCYVMCSNGVWYSADDSRITPVSTRAVFISRPYILFYKRKREKPPMKPVIVNFQMSESELSSEEEESY